MMGHVVDVMRIFGDMALGRRAMRPEGARVTWQWGAGMM